MCDKPHYPKPKKRCNVVFKQEKCECCTRKNGRDASTLPEVVRSLATYLDNMNSVGVELILNEWMAKLFNADAAFILFTTKQCCVLYCRAMGKKLLTDLPEFKLVKRRFKDAIYKFKPFNCVEMNSKLACRIESYIKGPVLSMMCVPIFFCSNKEYATALYVVVNKRISQVYKDMGAIKLNVIRTENFLERDIKVLLKLFNNFDYTKFQGKCSFNIDDICVLSIGWRLFHKTKTIDKVIQFTSVQLRNYLNADACSIYAKKNAKILDIKSFGKSCHPKANKILKKASLCMTTGGSVVKCVKENRVINHLSMFSINNCDRYLDSLAGYLSKTMLVVPIEKDCMAIGCIELSNKLVDCGFSILDEELAKQFAELMLPLLESYFPKPQCPPIQLDCPTP